MLIINDFKLKTGAHNFPFGYLIYRGVFIMNICVYGASSNTVDKIYVEKTEELGRKMAEHGHGLVFGGGSAGMMGAVARGVHAGGGHIIGVAPTFFNVDGLLYEHCNEFISTETMRERKKALEDNADCFIVTPGGIGTFDEFFEMITLKQLGRTDKAIAIYNVNGYYDSLDRMVEKGIEGNFIQPICREIYKSFDDADELLDYLENYEPTVFDIGVTKGLAK